MRADMDWNGHPVVLAESVGGVLAFADYSAGLIRGGVSPWPPPEIVQKLYQSRQTRAFREADLETATGALHYYSDLQSVHSEDAVTWNLFGPLVHASPEARAGFVGRLLSEITGTPHGPTPGTIWLWRRLPHPDTLVPGGPEIDFGIQTAEHLVLGEAKWRSGVGTAQGVSRDKDQVDLRTEFCEKYGGRVYPTVTRFSTLLVSPRRQDTSARRQVAGPPSVAVTSRTWAELGALLDEPARSEFLAQLAWRESRSQAL